MKPYHKKKTIPCRHFMAGKCTKANCQFIHEKKAMPTTANTDVLIAMLRLLFEKNTTTIYADGVLNLQNFRECPDLIGVQNSVDFNAVNFCNALTQVIKEKIGSPEFLNIDNNGVKSVYHLLKSLEKNNCHLTLKGLSAADNQISSFDFVKQLNVCPQLVEVVFKGNPISADPEYRMKVRKGLPTLLGVDGKGLDLQPLATPWPVPTVYSEQAIPLLLTIESGLFRTVETHGVDGLMTFYSTQSVFTFTVQNGAEFSTPIGYPKNKKEIPRDFVALRSAHTDLNRNMIKGPRTRAVKSGRMDVIAAMRETLYPSRFTVSHTLDPNANVEFLSAGVKEPLAVATLHGTMAWKHVDQLPSDEPTRRHFDRTLVLKPLEAGGMEIVRDSVNLRMMTSPDPLLFPKNQTRLVQLGSRYHIPADTVGIVVEAVGAGATPEVELHQTLNALRRIGTERWGECIQLCPSNPSDAIKIARVVEHYRLSPSAAMQALVTTQGDAGAIQNLISSLPPESFIAIV